MHARHNDSVLASEHAIPLETVTFSGHRYVATADLGMARPVPLMVHGNARVFLSLVHAVAEKMTGGPVHKLEAYGYSARGKGRVDVPRLRLGDAVFDDIRDVPVFDFTDATDDPVQGMLGTKFLTSAHAAVDFTSDRLLLGVAMSHGPDARLIGRGWRTVPIRVASDGRVTIEAFFPAIDRVLRITPSTVANALTLHAPLFAGRLVMEPSGADRSPSGTSPAVFSASGVAFEIGGIECRANASLEDLAEYGAVVDEALESHGMLGFDWMREHGAVIDYANRVLYFQP